ncbi:MAG: hypothetical protein AAGU23_01660 [Bacillota bacterium]
MERGGEMEGICPLCNGLQAVDSRCPMCGQPMVDGGSLQDFYGPYSPYEEKNTYGKLAVAGRRAVCIHLLYCPSCGYDRREQITQVLM